MKRIGLLSDTHAYWDEKYRTYFADCDEIWHAGDIGSLEVATRLAALHPLRAVCGNCDGGDLRRLYPTRLRWNCEGADILMTHIGGYPGRYAPDIRNQLYARPPQSADIRTFSRFSSTKACNCYTSIPARPDCRDGIKYAHWCASP